MSDELVTKAARSELSDDAFRVLLAALRGEPDLDELLAEMREQS